MGSVVFNNSPKHFVSWCSLGRVLAVKGNIVSVGSVQYVPLHSHIQIFSKNNLSNRVGLGGREGSPSLIDDQGFFFRKTDTMPANLIVGVLTARQDTMPVI